MIVNQAALKRQVTVLALLVIIVIAGIYCYATLPRESFPDITIPYVFVTTTYEGVAPEDMEQLNGLLRDDVEARKEFAELLNLVDC